VNRLTGFWRVEKCGILNVAIKRVNQLVDKEVVGCQLELFSAFWKIMLLECVHCFFTRYTQPTEPVSLPMLPTTKRPNCEH